MASKALSVYTVFYGVDKVTATTKLINRSISNFSTKSLQNLGNISKSTNYLSDGFKNLLKYASAFAIMRYTTSAIKEAVVAGMEFDAAMSKAAAKFGNIHKGTQAFANIEKGARDAVKGTEFTVTQGAKGLEVLALAGYSAQQAYTLLPSYIDLATSSGLEFSEATEVALGIMGQFNLKTTDTAKLLTNSTRVMDVLAKTSTSSMTDIYGLSESFSYAGSVANTVGVDIETLSAMIGKLGDANIRGTMAGTTLKNSMLRLVAPSKEASKAMRMIGVQVEGTDGKMRDFFDILADMKEGLKEYSEVEQSAALDTIFGQRAITGMSRLLSLNISDLREYRDTLYKANGSMNQMASTIRDSLQYRFLMLKSTLSDLSVSITHALEPALAGILSEIEPVVSAVNDWVIANKSVISQKLLNFFDSFVTFIAKMSKIMPIVIELTKIYFTYWAYTKIMGVISSIDLMVQAVLNLKAAQVGLNAVSKANVYLIIATAIITASRALGILTGKLKDYLREQSKVSNWAEAVLPVVIMIDEVLYNLSHPLQFLYKLVEALLAGFNWLRGKGFVSPFATNQNRGSVTFGGENGDTRSDSTLKDRLQASYLRSQMAREDYLDRKSGTLDININAPPQTVYAYKGGDRVKIRMGTQPIIGGAR